ncbi:TetR/AcrR family transcriptional regulator [Pseudobutyrivibrio xylanivorans]|uniref:Transcriptional regulator, TetR family n=1 Tax=Pseudobutyrivibrio xylanivorans DSM 14809 TaxID=1123012 RepID=A0A1M6L605_PSEXY|nr:TetR/AcrR family transcriptional regulator [Pseudobutyrivibrio xylanivorans]SHJ66641.1 transcriptional regulator, TetR family [Pseudobutyrivibrio xylanivorans DSM 14809]
MNELDERYVTVEEAIVDAFFILSSEKEFEKITVSDVVKKSGVVRSTFYNHYENVPALLSAAEDKTIEDIFQLMESFHPKDDHQLCKSYFLAICNYTKENKFLASVLHSPRGDSFLEKAMMMFHKYVATVSQGNAMNINKQQFSYLIAATIGATLGVLHKWTAEACETPAEEIADILTTIFLNGVLPFMEN